MIAGGDWYPRWFPQQYGGYGYPTLNFYAPGLYYLTLAPGGAPGPGQAQRRALRGDAGLGRARRPLGHRRDLLPRLADLAQRPARRVVAGATVAYAPYVVQGNLYISGGLPHVLGLGALAFLLACLTGLWQEAVPGAPAGALVVGRGRVDGRRSS